MKNKRFFINEENTFTTFFYDGNAEDFVPKEGMLEVNGHITIIVRSEFLYVEKQLPIHFKEWIKDAKHLEGNWWFVDKEYFNVESFSTHSLSLQLGVDLPEVTQPRHIELLRSSDEDSPTELNITIILTDDSEILKRETAKEHLAVRITEDDVSIINATYVEMLTLGMLEEVAVAIIRM